MNHLIGSNLRISETTSETRSVVGFTTETHCEQLKYEGLKFTVVDTPGFDDADGLAQDACNIRAVQKYTEKHLWVNGNISFPNIILLCVKATDNRVIGPETDLIKTIRTLESLNVIDSRKPNLIIVVTHACFFPKKVYAEKKLKLEKMYQEAIKAALNCVVPVVLIENNFDDYDLAEDDRKTGTVLPDREIQPPNLFHTIMDVLRNNNDELALMTLREVYRNAAKVEFSHQSSAQAKKPNNVTELDEDETQCWNLLVGNMEAHTRKLNVEMIKLDFQHISFLTFPGECYP